MVCMAWQLIIKLLIFNVCYGSFYSSLSTTLRNCPNWRKGTRQSQFALHQSVPPDGQRVYNGEASGDGVTIGCRGHHGGWRSHCFSYINPCRIK